jgi:hypothetical protein
MSERQSKSGFHWQQTSRSQPTEQPVIIPTRRLRVGMMCVVRDTIRLQLVDSR